MSISSKTRKLLWGSFAGHCAKCDAELIKQSFSSNASLIGQEAHIIAQNKGGPRWCPGCSKKEINSFENLILLCNNCHDEIDKNEKRYTIEKLRQIREDALCRTKSRLEQNNSIEKDFFVEKVISFLDFADWNNHSFYLTKQPPRIHEVALENMEIMKIMFDWLKKQDIELSRITPQTLSDIDIIFRHFFAIVKKYSIPDERMPNFYCLAEFHKREKEYYKFLWDKHDESYFQKNISEFCILNQKYESIERILHILFYYLTCFLLKMVERSNLSPERKAQLFFSTAKMCPEYGEISFPGIESILQLVNQYNAKQYNAEAYELQEWQLGVL